MALTERQLALVKGSFKALQEDIKPRSIEFYDHFFRHAPELKSMFRLEDLGGQGMRFMSTLSVIIDNLENPDALTEKYADLGQAHRALGVKADFFEPMGLALIETLQGALGEEFTDEMREAWETAYAELSRKIIETGHIPEE